MRLSREPINAYRGLIADLEDKIISVDVLANKINLLGQEINSGSGKIPDEKMMAMAGYLHHFYSGIEDIFGRIIKTMDGYLPGSGDWHSELLYIVSRKTPGIRPAIISTEICEVLSEYKAFRHLFRHAYAKELRWRRMDHLALDINQVWSSVRISIIDITVFLKKIIDTLESSR